MSDGNHAGNGASVSFSAAWVLLTGLGIGWLAGLSVSPVASAVLSSLLGLAAGVTIGLQTLRNVSAKGDRPAVDPRPVALLTIAIAVGAPLGITARTHGWFAPASSGTSVSAGVPPLATQTSALAVLGALFSDNASACDEVQNAQNEPGEVFRRTFRRFFPHGPQLDSIIADSERLRLLTQILCSSE